MRLIDADALFKEISSFSIETSIAYGFGFYEAIRRISKVIANSPTIDTVKHGKWVSDIVGVTKCSVCKHQAYFLRGYELFDYCPYCGAKMDGDKQ